MHLARGLSSKLIFPQSVPLLGEAQNILWSCTILSEISENHKVLCILQYLAPVAFKTPLNRCCTSSEPAPGHGPSQQSLTDTIGNPLKIIFHYFSKYFFIMFLATLAAESITDWKPLLCTVRYNTLETLFHEPGHTCLLFSWPLSIGLSSQWIMFSPSASQCVRASPSSGKLRT